MLSAIVGINWGDEGKGRMVDQLSGAYDVVVRYQGGNNAGHTVVNDRGKFILNLLPSGILREDTVNVLANGMVVDPEHLTGEIAALRSAGIAITPERLKISSRATICMPYHRLQDCLEEDRLGTKKYGSTRRGIGPAYADKYMKKTLRMGDLRDMEVARQRLAGIVEWKNLTIAGGYGHAPVRLEEMQAWLEQYAAPLLPFVCDTGAFLTDQVEQGAQILFEAQLGALRDIDFGIYPYTSSSNSLAAYAPVGAGIPQYHLDEVIGVMKAYSTCVGAGPFPCEMTGASGDWLREAGGEYGAATGRPRRVGGFDLVASRYGVRMQGATRLALTKLDVLTGMERIPVCTSYEVDGVRTCAFPEGAALERAKPVYTDLDGWQEDISACRSYAELPAAARRYVEFLEEQVDCTISYLSVGPERDALIVR